MAIQLAESPPSDPAIAQTMLKATLCKEYNISWAEFDKLTARQILLLLGMLLLKVRSQSEQVRIQKLMQELMPNA